MTATITGMWARISYHRNGTWRQDLLRLHARGLSDAAVARELTAMHPGQTFTRRQVWYYLHEDDRVAQEGECVSLRPPDLWQRRRVYQVRKGFGHLLPGLTLRHRESDILALLRDRGTMTRPQIAERLGVKTLRTRHQHWMGRLRRAGLVDVRGRPGYWKTYSLAPRALAAVG